MNCEPSVCRCRRALGVVTNAVADFAVLQAIGLRRLEASGMTTMTLEHSRITDAPAGVGDHFGSRRVSTANPKPLLRLP